MPSVSVQNNTNTSIGLPGSFGVLTPQQSRTWADVPVAEIESAGADFLALQAAGAISFNVFNPAMTANQQEVAFTNAESVLQLAPIVVEEFTNVPTAVTNYFVAATATQAVASTITTFAANALTIPRRITISRSAAVASYTTSVISIQATLYGNPITLTFTPATADGGDTIQSNEAIGALALSSISIPAQVDGAGSFTVGFGAGIGLRYPMVSRAGLLAPVKQIAIGAVVTTGTFAAQYYIPAAAPNGTNDYCLYYERG